MAQPTDKQFDALLGISRKMEDSLAKIEKSMAPGGAAGKAGEAVGNLASMALSVSTIIKALSSKDFKKQTAGNVLHFIEGMAAATQKLNPDNLKSLAEFSSGFSKFIDTMSNISLMGLAKLEMMGNLLFSGRNPFLKRIIHGAMKAVDGFSKEELDKIKMAGEGISMLASGLKLLTKAMASLALIAIAAPLVLIGAGTAWVVVKMFTALGKKADEIKAGGEAIQALAKGLSMLSVGLAMMGIVAAIIDFKTVFKVVAIVAALSLVFALVGKAADRIGAGAKAMKEMGVALVALSAGIALISLVVLLVPPKVLFEGMLLIAGYALVFAIVGKASKYIAEGALTLILGIAVGLFFFSGALLLFSAAIQRIGIGEAFLGIGLLFGFALLFSFLGEDEFIYEGAIAIGAMGAGLAVFSIGLILYSLALKGVIALFKNNWEVAALGTVGIIMGLGVLFSFLGAAIEVIAPGAIGLGLMGGALAVFSIGLILYSLALKGVIALFKNNWEIAAAATAGIILGLGGMFALLGVMIVPIALGAASMVLMGVTLIAFSIGMILYALATKAVIAMGLYDEKNKEFKGVGLLESVAKGISSLAWYIVPLAIATPVALALGTSLIAISDGLLAASVAVSKIPDAKAFTDKLFDKKTGLIYAIAGGFAAISKDPDLGGGGGGLLGSLVGGIKAITGTSPVQLGIRIVDGLGGALSEIAGGIAAFANFESFPIKNVKDGKLVDDTVNLYEVPAKIQKALLGTGAGDTSGFLMTIAGVFSEIGKSFGGEGFLSLLKDLTGTDPVSLGIRIVKDIGGALQSVAGGIVAFANWENFPVQVPSEDGTKLIYKGVDLTKVPEQIKKILIGDGTITGGGFMFTLASLFADISKAYPNGFFGGDSDAKKGADIVKEAGAAIGGIAGGITAFADLQKAVPIEFDEKGKPTKYGKIDIETIKKNMTDMITTIPNVFGGLDTDMLEKAKTNADSFGSITSVLKTMGESLKTVKDVFVSKDAKAGQPGVLTLLANELKGFVEFLSKTPIEDSIVKGLNNLVDVFGKFAGIASPFKEFTSAFKDFNSTMGSFAGNMEKFSKNFTKFSPQLKNYEKFAALLNGQAYYAPRFTTYETAFAKMAADLEVFGKNFKIMDAKAIDAFRIWTEALTNFVQIDPANFNTLTSQIEKVINAPIKAANAANNAASTENPLADGTAKGAIDKATAQKTPPPVKPAEAPKPSAKDNAVQQQISQLADKIDRLISALSSETGIKVHVIN